MLYNLDNHCILYMCMTYKYIVILHLFHSNKRYTICRIIYHLLINNSYVKLYSHYKIKTIFIYILK